MERGQGTWFKGIHQIIDKARAGSCLTLSLWTDKVVLWECPYLLASDIFIMFLLNFPWQGFFMLLKSDHIFLKEWFSSCRLIDVVFTVTEKSHYFWYFNKLVFWWRRWNSWKNLPKLLHLVNGKINRWQKLKHVAIKCNQLQFVLGIHSSSVNPMWKETRNVFPIANSSITEFVNYPHVNFSFPHCCTEQHWTFFYS